MAATKEKTIRGWPTSHRIRFRSPRSIVESGVRFGDAEEICEYEGFLFDDFHTTSHLCVLVEKEEHWVRRENWHGMVAKGGVIQVEFVADGGRVVTQDELAELTDDGFRAAWGHLCCTSD